MTKFKIQGIGLDTSTINYDPGNAQDKDVYDYIYTSIPANNDFLVGRYIWSMENNPSLITYVDCLDGINYLLESHLNVLKRDKVDILLIKSGLDLGNAGNVASLIAQDKVKYVGMQNPDNVKDLEQDIFRLKEIGITVSYIALTICPLEFNVEIINFCREIGVEIIGLNAFGGYISAPRNIMAFSVPYLLGFSSFYSDVVILSGRDLINSWQDKEYIKGFIDKDADPGYILKKSTYKPVKEIKKAVYTSLSMDNGKIIPYEEPDRIVMPKDFRFRIGSYLTNLGQTKREKLVETNTTADMDVIFKTLDEEVNHFLNIIYYPEDGTPGDLFAMARYKTIDYLGTHFNSALAEIDQIKIGNNLLMINVSQPETKENNGWFKKKKVIPGFIRQFYLILGDGSTKEDIIFSEILADEKE